MSQKAATEIHESSLVWVGNDSEIGKKWIYLSYALEVELTEFAGGLDVMVKGEGIDKNDSKVMIGVIGSVSIMILYSETGKAKEDEFEVWNSREVCATGNHLGSSFSVDVIYNY